MLLLLSLCRVKTQWNRMHHERFTEFRISCSEWLIVAVLVVLEFCRFSMSMILRMMDLVVLLVRSNSWYRPDRSLVQKMSRTGALLVCWNTLRILDYLPDFGYHFAESLMIWWGIWQYPTKFEPHHLDRKILCNYLILLSNPTHA